MVKFNDLRMIPFPADGQKKTASRKLFSSAPSRQTFSETINLSSQLTQPEDQGSYGTCVAWSTTTFLESLLWKLTGEKEEFTKDEIYNLFLDTYQYDPDLNRIVEIDANQRRAFRGENGLWENIPSTIADRGLYHYVTNGNISTFPAIN